MFRSPICRRAAVLLPTLLVACAQGGQEDRPQSEVRITANHHLYWFRTLPGFGTFPVNPAAVFAGHGTFALNDQSEYSLTVPNNPTTTDRYALETNGDYSVFVTGNGRDPSVVFRGGYELAGNTTTPDFFFTDRVSLGGSLSIGLYYGTRVILGQAELEGGWHLLSLHTVFSGGLISPHNVARAAHGGVSVDAGAPGTARSISGTGSESSGITLTFGGQIQNLLDGGGQGDGSCNLTVSYTGGGNSDSRVCRAAAGRDLVMAVDEDESDGEAGMVFLVRKFDAPATPADPANVAGDFFVGGQTLFVNPTNSGSDTFVGRLRLTQQGGFTLDAQDHLGQSFSYTGTYTVADDGGLTISIQGTNETWFAAINRTYDTVIIADDVVETRANNTPELNLAICVRVKP